MQVGILLLVIYDRRPERYPGSPSQRHLVAYDLTKNSKFLTLM
jgi:hypothetical protein